MADQYDPNVAQDHTGMVFKHVLKRDKRRPRELYLFKNPRLAPCPECGEEKLWVIADDADTGLMVIQCPKCKAMSRPIECRVPQMDDHKARELGIWVPRLSFEMDIDLED
jgi:transposase